MMKILTGPTVRVVSRPVYLPIPEAELPDHDNEAENIIAVAGKVCYDSYGKDGRSIEQHVQGLAKEKHGSVLEHIYVGLFIAGVSRGLTHELIRHRAGFAYSQRSTRYADEDDCAIVLNPEYARLYQLVQERQANSVETLLIQEHLRGFSDQLGVYTRAVNGFLSIAPKHLDARRQRKWARGNARQNLPHALESRLVVTANLRAWRTFLNQRSNRGAEAEIRRLSNVVFPLLYEIAPNAFIDVGVETIDGYKEYRCPAI